MVGRLRHLEDSADVRDGLALGDQLLGGFELADDLIRCVPGAFHGGIPGTVWPVDESHSPWPSFRCRLTFRGPRHQHRVASEANHGQNSITEHCGRSDRDCPELP